MINNDQKITNKPEILIVDDSKLNLEMLSYMLKANKYSIKTALDARMAMGLLAKFSFELILLDVIMPGMDGFELCKRIKSRPKTKDIPIIFITSRNDEKSIVKGLSIGAVDFITKPFSESELLARIDVHIKLKQSQKMLKRELINRKKAERLLRLAYEKIEETVDIRTKALKKEIEERSRAELVLGQKEQLLKISQKISKTGSWVYNMALERLWCSEALLEMIEIDNPEKELSIHEYENFIDEKDLPKFKEIFLSSIIGIGGIVEYKIKSNRGNERYFEHRFLARKNNMENKNQLIGTVMDITERRIAEEFLREQQDEVEKAYLTLSEQNVLIEYQKNQLQDVNATKDKFFSIIAHDLKNPFQHIMGFSDLMLNEYDTLSDEERIKFIGYIYNSSRQVFDLLENLLEWSRTQTNQIKFNPNRFNITDIINETITINQIAAKNKKINLYTKIDKPIWVFADHNMINACVRNLVTNAIKFTNEGGTIFIDAKSEKNIVTIEVTDNGIGITPENIKKLFRIDESFSLKGTNNESGTGLGLVLCKEFTEKNGGKIWAESQPEVGSSFYFTLPENENTTLI